MLLCWSTGTAHSHLPEHRAEAAGSIPEPDSGGYARFLGCPCSWYSGHEEEYLKIYSDTLNPLQGDELLGTPHHTVTFSRRRRQSRWLSVLVYPDNCGAIEWLLPQARVQADYDVPALATGSGYSFRRRTLAGPGRRYVSEVG